MILPSIYNTPTVRCSAAQASCVALRETSAHWSRGNANRRFGSAAPANDRCRRLRGTAACGRSEKSGTTASPSREGLQRGSNTAVEWKALQFHQTLFVRSNPDQDRQSTELRNAGGF